MGRFKSGSHEEYVYWCNFFCPPPGLWEVASVTDMERMVCFAIAFNQPVAQWDVSNVRTMEKMFEGATSFISVTGNQQWLPTTTSMFQDKGCEFTADPDVNQAEIMSLWFSCDEFFFDQARTGFQRNKSFSWLIYDLSLLFIVHLVDLSYSLLPLFRVLSNQWEK